MAENIMTEQADRHSSVIGYWINAPVSDEMAAAIDPIQRRLEEALPQDVWTIPRYALHISLMNIVNPYASYDGEEKDALFARHKKAYVAAARTVIKSYGPLSVEFTSVEAYPGAIIARGHDDGSFDRLRHEINENIDLEPGTRPLPDIVHVTIAKFRRSVPLAPISEQVGKETIDAAETVSSFRLIRESVLFMIESETVESFPLSS